MPQPDLRCLYNVWISSTAGGPPIGGKDECSQVGVMGDAAVTFYNTGPLGGTCSVLGSTEYYCNVAGCPGAVNAPLGVNDYTQEEGIAMSEGQPCTYGLMYGHFRRGVCTDDQGNTTPPPDHRISCTNEAQKVGNECISCGGFPMNCQNAKIIADCRTTCK